MMDKIALAADESGDKTMVILQSLLCVLREKNLLTRADIEDLCDKVQARVADQTASALPCCSTTALAAASEMGKIGDYIGRRYGGKHRRN
jgi:hypothetical protein